MKESTKDTLVTLTHVVIILTFSLFVVLDVQHGNWSMAAIDSAIVVLWSIPFISEGVQRHRRGELF